MSHPPRRAPGTGKGHGGCHHRDVMSGFPSDENGFPYGESGGFPSDEVRGQRGG